MFNKIKEAIVNKCSEMVMSKINLDEFTEEIINKIDKDSIRESCKNKVMESAKQELEYLVDVDKVKKEIKKIVGDKERRDIVTEEFIVETGEQCAVKYINQKTSELAKYNWDRGSKKFSISKYVQNAVQKLIDDDLSYNLNKNDN